MLFSPIYYRDSWIFHWYLFDNKFTTFITSLLSAITHSLPDSLFNKLVSIHLFLFGLKQFFSNHHVHLTPFHSYFLLSIHAPVLTSPLILSSPDIYYPCLPTHFSPLYMTVSFQHLIKHPFCPPLSIPPLTNQPTSKHVSPITAKYHWLS